MTMKTEKRVIPAGKFKAECLAILDEVQESKESVIVTKRGKPVAIVAPYRDTKTQSLKNSVKFQGDVIGPILEDWDVEH
jgi:prevent-host-death family protein